MKKTLQNLLTSIEVNDFIKNYWTKKVFIQRGNQSMYQNIFNWNRFNNLLNGQIYNLSFPNIRLVHNNRLIPETDIIEYKPSRRVGHVKKVVPAKINKFCQAGATLVVDAINKLDLGLGNYCERLAIEFGDKTQMNAYCSWAGTQGFGTHYDLQEVFILQIEGSKDWEIYEDIGTEFPIVKGYSEQLDKRANPSIKCTLNKGDLLYIPRGIWHSAMAIGKPSLHLTLGVYCTYEIDFIDWYVKDTISSIPEFRRNIKCLLSEKNGNNGLDVSSLSKILTRFKEIIINNSLQEEQLRRFSANFLNKDNKSQHFNFPYSALQNPISDIDVVFYRPVSSQQVILNHSLKEAKEVIEVICGDKVLFFHKDAETLVRGIFSTESFSGKDALKFDEELNWNNIQPFLTRLVQEQILYIKNE